MFVTSPPLSPGGEGRGGTMYMAGKNEGNQTEEYGKNNKLLL